ALGHRGHASGERLWCALDLDEAQAAHGRRGHAGVVAVVRDRGPDLLGGFEDRGPLGDLDLVPVDRQFDHLSHQAAPTRSPRRIRARYSSLNLLMEDCTGAATESDSTQMVVPTMFCVTSIRVSRSCSVPRPSSIRFIIFAVQA